MTLTTYLTLLRPGRTVAASLIMAIAGSLIIAAAGISVPDWAFVTFCFVLPLTLGSLLVAPLHEVAHRSGFPLLPGAARQMLRSHCIAFAAAVLGISGFSALCVSRVPIHAAIGLIASCLALPLLDPKRGKTVGPNPAFNVLLAAGVLCIVFTRDEVAALACAAPWLPFAGGMVVTVFCFRIGFDRDRLRARCANPFYYAPQSTLVLVGTDILQHAQAEMARHAEQHSSRRTAKWSTERFRDTIHDWLHIAEHARFGLSRRSRSGLSVFAGTLIGTTIALLIGGLFHSGLDWPRWETYCRLIVEAARASGEIANKDVRLNFVMMPQIMIAIAVVGALKAAVPAVALPLSRDRQAAVLFLAFERRVLLAIAGGAAGTGIAMAAATVVAGQAWSFELLHRFTLFPALSLIVANLAAPAILSSRTLARVAYGLLIFPGFNIATFAVVLRDGGPGLSANTATVFATLALGSIAYTWFTFRHYYRTCDLTRTSDCLRRLGFRLG